MPKQIIFSHDAREALKCGLEKAARAVCPTLGPRGRSVVIDKSWGAPQITSDGSTVADEVEFKNPYENMGARLLKEAASKTSDDAGDGSTTAAVLAHAIFGHSFKLVASGAQAMAVSRGIRLAAAAVADAVKAQAEPLDPKDTARVVALAANAAKGNADVGRMLADAFAKVGKDGAISVEEGKGIDTEVKIVEGMQFDRGFLSPHFVTNADSVEAVLENPYILIHEDKLSSVAPLIPLLEKLAEAKASLLVIAEDVEAEALSTLVVNKLRGILPAAAVKAPGYGDRRRAMLEDIATLTAGRAVFKDLGIDLAKINLADLGRAKKVIVDSEFTTIIEGAGNADAVKERCAQIRREVEECDSDYDREKLQERLSKLTGGVAQIYVGAATETELKDRKQKVEGALAAVRSAFAEGVVPGGGVAFLRAAPALDKVHPVGDEKLGVDAVRRALSAPLKQLASNAGFEPTIIARQVEAASGWTGFDVVAGKTTDLKQAGIIDPSKVVRTALVNAASVAAMLVTAECLISDIPESSKAADAAAGE